MVGLSLRKFSRRSSLLVMIFRAKTLTQSAWIAMGAVYGYAAYFLPKDIDSPINSEWCVLPVTESIATLIFLIEVLCCNLRRKSKSKGNEKR